MRRTKVHQNPMLMLGLAVVLLFALGGCDTGDVTAVEEPAQEPEVEEGATADEGEGYEEIRALLPERIAESGRIIVSNPLQNPPYAFIAEDGETLHGIAPDLSRALEPILGVEFDWIDTAFPGLIPGLQAGEFDMIWGSITDTEEREEILDFVTYHMDGAQLLVAAGNPTGIESLDNTCGQTIATLEGAVQIEMLEAQSVTCVDRGEDHLDIRLFPSVPAGQLAVRSGQANAFFAGLGAARYQATVAGNIFETAGPVYQAAPFGAGFRKGDELAHAIQEGLRLLVRESPYMKILEEYGMAVVALDEDQIMVNGAAQLSRDELLLEN